MLLIKYLIAAGMAAYLICRNNNEILIDMGEKGLFLIFLRSINKLCGFKNSNNIFYSVYNWYGIFIFSLVFLISNWNLGYFFRRIPSCSTSLPILSLWISITNALVI